MKEKKKTILFTLDTFHIGGVTGFVRWYAKALIKKGNEVVIVGCEDNLEDPEAFFEGSTVVVIPRTFEYSLLRKFVTFFHYRRALKQIYKKYPNLSHVHFSITWSTLFALSCRDTWRKNRVITFYGAYDLEAQSSGEKNALRSWVRKILHAVTLWSSHTIVTFSEYSKQLIASHFSSELENRVAIIPGMVENVSCFWKDSSLEKEVSLVNFGRAEHRKGIDLLIQAAQKVQEAGWKVRLSIASPYEYYLYTPDILKAYQESNLFFEIQLLPSANMEQKRKLLAKADLFIMPSRQFETFGLTILEAVAVGVPVIGTPVGAIPEVLNSLAPGFVSHEVSADALAKKILWYCNLSFSAKREKMQRMQKNLVKKYALEQFEEAIESLYRD